MSESSSPHAQSSFSVDISDLLKSSASCHVTGHNFVGDRECVRRMYYMYVFRPHPLLKINANGEIIANRRIAIL